MLDNNEIIDIDEDDYDDFDEEIAGNRYTQTTPICPRCHQKMKLYDMDIQFRGCQDNYWSCKCGICARNKVRYGNELAFKFVDENGNEVKEVK